MSEFEDKLNELLNDPGQMERIAGIAKSLMGGEAPPENLRRTRGRMKDFLRK